MPSEFGPWATVYRRFRVWRDAGVFSALLEGMIAEAARRGQADLSLVSVDSTTARAHHDAAGMHIGKDVMELMALSGLSPRLASASLL
jgi:transposase